MKLGESQKSPQGHTQLELKVVMEKSRELGERLKSVLLDFCEENNTLPAQVVMASLGELLLQFSDSQVGPAMTNEFLIKLQTLLKETHGNDAH